jgi:hypothetical protein
MVLARAFAGGTGPAYRGHGVLVVQRGEAMYNILYIIGAIIVIIVVLRVLGLW